MRTMLAVALLASLTATVCAKDVLVYDFASDQPFVVDRSGNNNHGLAGGAQRVTDGGRTCLRLDGEGGVKLPEAELLLGEQAERGSIELSVKPDFDPSSLATGVYEGWVVLMYVQKSSTNGLPDGYNEIGLALHGPKLRAKVAGGSDTGAFATIDTPLEKGKWTRLKLEWAPGRRSLYVDGQLSVERTGDYVAPIMDMFPAYIGQHPGTGKWSFSGLVSDIRISRGE